MKRFNLVIEKLLIPTATGVGVTGETGVFQSRNRETFDSNNPTTARSGIERRLEQCFNLVIEKLLIPTFQLIVSCRGLRLAAKFQSRNRETFDSNHY